MNKGYLRPLDGLRLIAVSFVMLDHWTFHSSYSKMLGWLANSAVNLFFVLSGFLIARILMTQKQKAPQGLLMSFYGRRFLRIFPLYYLAIALCLVFKIPAARENLYSLLFYVSNFKFAFTGINPGYVSHLWSLAVEEQFYIVFPILLLSIPVKYAKQLFFALIVISLLSRVTCIIILKDYTARVAMYLLTPCCFDCFGIGALLAYYGMYEQEKLTRLLSKKKLACSFFLLAVILQWVSIQSRSMVYFATLPRLFFSFFAFWLIGNAANNRFHGIFGYLLNNAAVVYLGKISYGLYVYHFILTYFFSGYTIPAHYLFYFLATVGIASVSWFIFEKPVNSLKRFLPYERPDPGAAGTMG
ncbi:MAG TPA: acyltransferase [Puia sp.]|nr:acyltransferase [Puia sp.]